MYYLACQGFIAALSSKEQWETLDLGFTVGPPRAKSPRGRPKKQRTRGIDEEDGKRKVTSKMLILYLIF